MLGSLQRGESGTIFPTGSADQGNDKMEMKSLNQRVRFPLKVKFREIFLVEGRHLSHPAKTIHRSEKPTMEVGCLGSSEQTGLSYKALMNFPWLQFSCPFLEKKDIT